MLLENAISKKNIGKSRKFDSHSMFFRFVIKVKSARHRSFEAIVVREVINILQAVNKFGAFHILFQQFYGQTTNERERSDRPMGRAPWNL